MQRAWGRLLLGFFWNHWFILYVGPWIERGKEVGTVVAIGPFRFGWKGAR